MSKGGDVNIAEQEFIKVLRFQKLTSEISAKANKDFGIGAVKKTRIPCKTILIQRGHSELVALRGRRALLSGASACLRNRRSGLTLTLL